jgi:hypothetical protein
MEVQRARGDVRSRSATAVDVALLTQILVVAIQVLMLVALDVGAAAGTRALPIALRVLGAHALTLTLAHRLAILILALPLTALRLLPLRLAALTLLLTLLALLRLRLAILALARRALLVGPVVGLALLGLVRHDGLL